MSNRLKKFFTVECPECGGYFVDYRCYWNGKEEFPQRKSVIDKDTCPHCDSTVEGINPEVHEANNTKERNWDL